MSRLARSTRVRAPSAELLERPAADVLAWLVSERPQPVTLAPKSAEPERETNLDAASFLAKL